MWHRMHRSTPDDWEEDIESYKYYRDLWACEDWEEGPEEELSDVD